MSLQMKNITKNFKNIKALNDVSINFEENKIIGLIGFNGSGKTTSFNVLTNLIEKFDGQVTMDNKPFKEDDFFKISYLSAGYEAQNDDSITRHLLYIGLAYGLNKDQTLKKINELNAVVQIQGDLNQKIKKLSKGNQQKIKLIAAFLNPNLKYLLMDEPFDGLDPIMIDKIKKFILTFKERVTIIITSHRMEVVDEMCDSFYILKDGLLVEHKNKNKINSITIITNLETDIKKLENIKEVLSIQKLKNEIWIEVDSIKSFKKINKILIEQTDYIWSSLHTRSLTEAVFERYNDEK